MNKAGTNWHLISLFVTILLLFTSCQLKFDKKHWNKDHDRAFPSPLRSKMLKDLTLNHKLIGLTCEQLRDKLGYADYMDDSLMVYEIEIDYGGDTDPIHNKSLNFIFSKDSVIRSFKIDEWKK